MLIFVKPSCVPVKLSICPNDRGLGGGFPCANSGWAGFKPATLMGALPGVLFADKPELERLELFLSIPHIEEALEVLETDGER